MLRSTKFLIRSLWIASALLGCSAALAAVFPLPSAGDDIVGKVQTVIVQRGDNFPKIAQQYGVTYTGLIESNPGVDPQHPAPGTALIVPSEYVLPNVPRKGIVINLAELRLYYYPRHSHEMYTYPIGIGVQGWSMPLGELKIIEKIKNPSWHIPPDIHVELAKKGFILPDVLPPGPENPLGDFAMRLSSPTYLIHGVVDPTTVGRRSSSGCVRMYPENIAALFSMVPVGTPVRIINQPYKVGWQNGQLYLEAHLPLQEEQVAQNVTQSEIQAAVNPLLKKSTTVDWSRAYNLGSQAMGLPEVIGAENQKIMARN